MNSDEILEPGQQIARVPYHAKGNINHPDAEWGFIQETRGATALCRFWRKDTHHQHVIGNLRTVANAESANVCDLVPHQHCRQDIVNNFLRLRGSDALRVRKLWGMPTGARGRR